MGKAPRMQTPSEMGVGSAVTAGHVADKDEDHAYGRTAGLYYRREKCHSGRVYHESEGFVASKRKPMKFLQYRINC